MNLNQQQQIESYLAGEMNPEEISAFESLIEVNPELRHELQFQTEVIKGIGEVRRAQLLARLDAIEVSAGWWSVIQNSSIIQYVGSAIVVAGFGGAAYWFLNNEPKQVSQDPSDGIIVSAPEYQSESWDFPEIERIEALAEETSEQQVEESALEESETKSVKEETKKTFNPVVAVPSAGDIEAEKDFVPQGAPTPEDVDKSRVNKTLEVEVVDTNTSRIKYRYYAGKLYLYGKFQEEPYQILEINSTAGRRIYLYHMNAFYTITPTDKPTGLMEVTDQKLIQELSILRNSK